jgi:soluble lytic murein transglycosylase-like protein
MARMFVITRKNLPMKTPVRLKTCAGFLAAIFVMFLTATSGWADIYTYIDKNGVIHFTNTPTSGRYRVYMKEPPKKTAAPRGINRYDAFIKSAARQHGVAFALVKSIIKVESNFNPKAVSHKGALGLMQIMPENVKDLKIKNPFDPMENIMGGARYFKRMLDRFNGKLSLALAAYNAGPEAVKQYQDIPPYAETENYVKKVLKYYYLYKKG